MTTIAILFVLALTALLLLRLPKFVWVSLFSLPYLWEFLSVLSRLNFISGPKMDALGTLPWAANPDISLVFNQSIFSDYFSLLISFIGMLIAFYASSYFSKASDYRRFYPAFLAFSASMLGLVRSDHMIGLFLFWEFTSLSSFLLIAFSPDEQKSRKAALHAFFVTGIGGLFLLAAILLIYNATGTWILSQALASSHLLLQSETFVYILLCLLVAIFTKSAQVPFHSWLPGAMAAPSPISAFLHSATMVKAGVFLLALISPLFFLEHEASKFFRQVVLLAGALSFVWGLWIAFKKTDLKQILAWTTISSLGAMCFCIGVGGEKGTMAFVALIGAHALYKASLFLCVGNIDHEYGTRDLNVLSGLFKNLPLTSVAFLLATLSMMGIPLFFGFVAKEYVLETLLQLGSWQLPFYFGLFLFGLCLSVIICFRFLKILFINSAHPQVEVHEAPVLMLGAPLVLAVVGLFMSMFIGPFNEKLFGPVFQSFNVKSELHAFGAWGPSLALSVAVFVAGSILYFFILKTPKTQDDVQPYGGILFHKVIKKKLQIAEFLSHLIQNKKLSNYFVWILLPWLLLLFYSMKFPLSSLDFSSWELEWNFSLIIAFFLSFAGLVAMFLNVSDLSRVLALGAIGYGVSLFFVSYGAPDLALTQVAIESLSVFIFILVLRRIKKGEIPRETFIWRGLRLFLSLSSGLVVFLLLVMAAPERVPSRLREFFETHSMIAANGKNVVNVILVDFRGLDTMGEISVLGLAALAIFGMLWKSKNGIGDVHK